MLRVTIKSLLAHKIRFVLTTFAVVIGVGFVVGTIVLTDSVRSQFNQLFVDINKGIDLQVRGIDRFDQGAFGQTPPIPDSLLPQVRAISGVKAAGGNAGGIKALVVGDDGKTVDPTGGPSLSITWVPDSPNSSLIPVEGGPPSTGTEVGLDVDTADRAHKQVGDRVTIITPIGPGDYTVSGIFKFGPSNSLSGATLAAFTLAEAQRINNLEGKLQSIDVSVEGSASVDEVQQSIQAILPDGVEVVPASTVVSDSQAGLSPLIDTFGNVLLGFAGVTLFVSAFLISNTFTIVVGQRVRELALLRAIGASPRQIALSVLGEALIVGILASILGFGIGILIALGLNAILSAAGFGSSSTSLVVSPSAFVAAFVVGIVVTMLSAISPAWKSTTVPPVAAMRDGFTFRGLSMRSRLLGGSAMALLGAVAIAWALFTSPDTVPLLFGMIGGALLVFLGVALLSPSVAAPMAHVLGVLYRPFKTSGHLAEENAARNPRRTASTASALMIGLALVTTVLVVGTSLKATFQDTIDKTITADWYVVPKSFVGFDPGLTKSLSDLPELSAVAAVRQGQVQVDGSTKQASAVDFGEVSQVFDLGLNSGVIDSDTRGVIVNESPAKDLGLTVGSPVTLVFNDTGSVTVPVVGISSETSFLGNWIIDMATFSANTSAQLDQTVAAKTAPGVSQDDARGRDRAAPRLLPGRQAPGSGRVHQGPAGSDRQPAQRGQRVPAAGHHHRRDRHHQHPGPVGVRAHPRARPAAGGGDEPAAAAADGPTRGGDRGGVRGRPRARRRSAVRVRRQLGAARQLRRRRHGPVRHADLPRDPRGHRRGARRHPPGSTSQQARHPHRRRPRLTPRTPGRPGLRCSQNLKSRSK